MRMKTFGLAAFAALVAVVLLASPAGASDPTPTRPGGIHSEPGPGPSAIVDPWVTPSEVEPTTAEPATVAPTTYAPTSAAPRGSSQAGPDAPTLPKTGPADGLLAGGAVLVIAGVGMLVFARRRRDSHAA